tara:strand:+ start:982 stop:1275 length:294 start_codon:yes stop_codon:yes gene_type:complete
MKNFIKINILMLMTLFIVGCSSDPEVQAVADNLVNESSGLDQSIADCMAKEAKSSMTDEEWDAYHAMVVDNDRSGMSEGIFTKMIGAGVKCGAPMPG